MSAERPVVFVVDDDQSMQRSLETLLRSVGHDVHLFSSADEFMHTERPDAPGCLVLDVRLPGMSGLTFQQELAKAGRLRFPVRQRRIFALQGRPELAPTSCGDNRARRETRRGSIVGERFAAPAEIAPGVCGMPQATPAARARQCRAIPRGTPSSRTR